MSKIQTEPQLQMGTAYIPGQTGMYDPQFEKDSCGVGFIVDLKANKSRTILDKALQMLINLEHRGAVGADPETGDGAGILIQMPHDFMKIAAAEARITLPKEGEYGVAFIFMPQDTGIRKQVENIFEKIVVDEDLEFLGWRKVPVDDNVPGYGAKLTLPYVVQAFVGRGKFKGSADDFERRLYLVRRVIDHRIRAELKLNRAQYYVPSFSSRTIVYKGMLLAAQVPAFFKDLKHPEMKSALALIHMRFSTNTFPTWDLAHPFRMIAHNGEINTLRGNINWMKTREAVMESPHYGPDLKRMLPIVMEGQSDSATFDTVLELLVMSGRSLPHAIMMMIPEAWSKNDLMSEERRAFYEYHATMMEPWDGPAAVAFTDGNVIGATLDRNGLRPARYIRTRDDLVIMASEVGVLDVPPEDIVLSGKLEPGRMFLIDLSERRIISDDEVKDKICKQQPYGKWVKENMIKFADLPAPKDGHTPEHKTMLERQRIFGYTKEDLLTVMKPMVVTGQEAVGSMGTDAALAVLSEKPQLLFRYFKQLFAQVTNPPVDAIREELVMELTTYIGPEQNLLDETPLHAHRIELPHPILENSQLQQLIEIAKGQFSAKVFSLHFNPAKKNDLRTQLDKICASACDAVRQGVNIVILSDRGVSREVAPIPSLLAVAAVHHALIRAGLRTRTGIVLESGEPRDVHHFALLLGYGANAINPYLAYETLHDLYKIGFMPELKEEAYIEKNYRKAIAKGLFKIFSKMGISTLQSYCGAQIFEAVGLDTEVVEQYFTGTPSRVEGVSLEMLEEEARRRHEEAFGLLKEGILPSGGLYHYRVDGEAHLWNPTTIAKLQISTRNGDYKTFKEYTAAINDQSKHRVTLRSLFEFDYAANPIPLEEVEPAKEIVKRFATGAMSFGSISWEAHTSLAIAMNRIGGKSNTGEGGEGAERFVTLPNGDSLRSAIKQVASGRFGVTANYLVNADELQIKMSQGAKPGEGGQLPGFKVDRIIGRVRHSTPGVTLISPPPHHDIYSIEDLKQLIFDLKNINPRARISVKLVSESGVGTVAAGVAKAHADHILISGHDGGTGASPISSIQYAGTPWELGLAETHQVLVVNGLRDRVYVQADGQMKTGRDVVVAALLGAEEFGFATAPLVTLGCIMMRKCHLNTCPVGVATQDPELRKKFNGKPEHVVNFMFYIAEEVREYMAKLGFRKLTDMVGRTEKLIPTRPKDHWKARGLDLSKLLTMQKPVYKTDLHRTKAQNHEIEKQIDNRIIEMAKPALDRKEPVKIQLPVTNVDRTVGAMLSGEVAKRYGDEGLPHDTIQIQMTGTAGQSFGCFLAKGITLRLSGQANDYCGKGLSGGRLIVRLPEKAGYRAEENIIIGNTCLYGATSGEAYFNGRAGERFAVRNSGVHAVVEGTGDHGCEYMTGGRVVVLGSIGRNFAAGMSGGIAYVWDPQNVLSQYVNMELVDIEELADEKDIDELLHMVTRHKEYTGSPRAAEILADWKNQVKNFRKIIPGEYKKALAALADEAQKENEMVDESKLKLGAKNG
jgi:glutamate synthase domain-containing protein 2/glutamate synthase domain-containing protein 1/glutamate synthase domain-containing protein 3